MLFLALLPAKRKTARFAFRAAKLGLCPALRGLLFALGGQRLPGLCVQRKAYTSASEGSAPNVTLQTV